MPFLTDDGELAGSPEELIRYDDVVQSEGASPLSGERSGNCYFMAALGALAETKPEMIHDNLSRDGDGYIVTFYRKEDDKFVPEHVSISDAEVEENARGGPGDYADDGDTYRVEQWARIYEAAYVKWKGGPDKVYEGGSPWSAMESLTGHESGPTTIQLNYLSPEQWKENIDRGDMIALVTADPPPTDWQQWLPWNMGWGGKRLYEDGTLDYNHVYMLKDIKGEGLDAKVELIDPRNPDETILIPYGELTMAYQRGAGIAVNMLGR